MTKMVALKHRAGGERMLKHWNIYTYIITGNRLSLYTLVLTK